MDRMYGDRTVLFLTLNEIERATPYRMALSRPVSCMLPSPTWYMACTGELGLVAIVTVSKRLVSTHNVQ
jgi:hypothetical protein